MGSSNIQANEARMSVSPDRTPTDDLDARITSAFSGAGHRLTAQRQMLIDLLRAHGGFLDAEELFDLAQLRGATLSLATVYRTLALFKQLDLVEGRIVGDGHDREQYRLRSVHQHYSLTCRRCGAIVPVEPDIVDDFRRQVTAELGVTVLSAHSCFVGYCADCTAALAAGDDD
jgi:Fur family ferric uptake transcriptional regulator